MKYRLAPQTTITVLFSPEEIEFIDESLMDSEYKFEAENPEGFWFKHKKSSSFWNDPKFAQEEILAEITFRNLDKISKTLEKYAYIGGEQKKKAVALYSKISTVLHECNAKSVEVIKLYELEITEL